MTGAAAPTRWRSARHGALLDATVALVMAAVTVGGSIGEAYPKQQDRLAGHLVPHPPAAAYLLVAAAALVLLWRRRRPVPVLVVSLAAVVAYTCLGYVDGAALLSPMVALYAVAVAVETRRAILLALLTMVALMGASAAFDPLGATGGGFVLIPGEVAAALFLGLAVTNRRAYLRQGTEEEARRRVDAERLRIARELHDVVAHTMAMINVQAGVAAHVIADQPELAASALASIKTASKEGLRELRAILNVLRQADEGEPTQPAPRLDQLYDLVAATTQAGLPTTVTVHGTARPLPPTVDLAAYRIIQESLTNALRYAGPATTTVSLGYQDGQLLVEVLDNGRGTAIGEPHEGSGQGIPGMRERAVAAGGSLDVGPCPGGGFRVRARLPAQVDR